MASQAQVTRLKRSKLDGWMVYLFPHSNSFCSGQLQYGPWNLQRALEKGLRLALSLSDFV